MTAAVARYHLQPLSMSDLQSGRRHSARLQQKDDTTTVINGSSDPVATKTQPTKSRKDATNGSKKRKAQSQEDDDGFLFSRVKKKQQTTVTSVSQAQAQAQPGSGSESESQKQSHSINQITQPSVAKQLNKGAPKSATGPITEIQAPQPPDEVQDVPLKKRRRMSFSTPAKKAPPTRRSKRLSTDVQETQGSPSAEKSQGSRVTKSHSEKLERVEGPGKTVPAARLEISEKPIRTDKTKKAKSSTKQPIVESAEAESSPPQPAQSSGPSAEAPPAEEEKSHSPTKIALPFADTPVISRNKAMREGKSSKAERRSSLGLRGRRASSLIDSGTSSG